jgi:dolichol-phosphate mannosyltransferase
MDISVVVPVHNEAENLQSLLGEIHQALEGRGDYEVIYVDDGSTDETLARLQNLQSEFPRLRVLRHIKVCGQSTALCSGIRAARADVIATLDGDGQNDPANIPGMWDALKRLQKDWPLAMVAGYRKSRKDTGWRKFSSRVANTVRAAMLRDDTPDTGCGLKVFSRELFLHMPYFDHMHRFLPALAQRQGGKVISVEVNHRPRLAGVSKYGTWQRLWVGIIDLFGVMWLQRRAFVPQIEEVKRRA